MVAVNCILLPVTTLHILVVVNCILFIYLLHLKIMPFFEDSQESSSIHGQNLIYVYLNIHTRPPSLSLKSICIMDDHSRVLE